MLLNQTVRLIIVDDHPLVREGIAMRISTQPNLQVCGEAESEDEAYALIEELRPDLVLVDISLKSGHGIELIKRIRTIDPKIKILVVSGFQESLYAERSLLAGATGYLNKQESKDYLLLAIRTVLSGQRFCSELITQRLLDRALHGKIVEKSSLELLTNRELEVLHLIGEGKTSSEIAKSLFISSHTIDSHRENIKRKLGVKNAAELARAAVQLVLENGYQGSAPRA